MPEPSGQTLSLPLMRPPRTFPGDRYGRLVVLVDQGSPAPGSKRQYLCRCDCGTEVVVDGGALRQGRTISCGCYKRDNPPRLKHGLSHSRSWNTYYSMMRRCTSTTSRHWADYGGRGIKVCDRWSGEDGFINFVADMGEPPEGLSLDRINNDGDYEPANCRWATWIQQANNRRPPGRRRRA